MADSTVVSAAVLAVVFAHSRPRLAAMAAGSRLWSWMVAIAGLHDWRPRLVGMASGHCWWPLLVAMAIALAIAIAGGHGQSHGHGWWPRPWP